MAWTNINGGAAVFYASNAEALAEAQIAADTATAAAEEATTAAESVSEAADAIEELQTAVEAAQETADTAATNANAAQTKANSAYTLGSNAALNLSEYKTTVSEEQERIVSWLNVYRLSDLIKTSSSYTYWNDTAKSLFTTIYNNSTSIRIYNDTGVQKSNIFYNDEIYYSGTFAAGEVYVVRCTSLCVTGADTYNGTLSLTVGLGI